MRKLVNKFMHYVTTTTTTYICQAKTGLRCKIKFTPNKASEGRSRDVNEQRNKEENRKEKKILLDLRIVRIKEMHWTSILICVTLSRRADWNWFVCSDRQERFLILSFIILGMKWESQPQFLLKQWDFFKTITWEWTLMNGRCNNRLLNLWFDWYRCESECNLISGIDHVSS